MRRDIIAAVTVFEGLALPEQGLKGKEGDDALPPWSDRLRLGPHVR
jgi:hypothetical protein